MNGSKPPIRLAACKTCHRGVLVRAWNSLEVSPECPYCRFQSCMGFDLRGTLRSIVWNEYRKDLQVQAAFVSLYLQDRELEELEVAQAVAEAAEEGEGDPF